MISNCQSVQSNIYILLKNIPRLSELTNEGYRVSKLTLNFFQASRTNALLRENQKIFAFFTENTGLLVFLQNDRIAVGINLKGILYLNVHCLTDLGGKYHSSKLIHSADHSGCFHVVHSFQKHSGSESYRIGTQGVHTTPIVFHYTPFFSLCQ